MRMSFLPQKTSSLVVHENVAALDVPVEEVLPVTIVQALHQLLHDGGVVSLGELHHAGLQEPHQVVVQVLKHQVEGALVLRAHAFKPYILGSRRIKLLI